MADLAESSSRSPQRIPPDPTPWLWVQPQADADVRYIGETHAEMICTLCLDVMTDAVCVNRCGHSFCEPCLQRSMQQKSVCPECRGTVRDYVPNFALRKLAASLRVLCPYDGCPTVMLRSELETHVNECLFCPAKCNVPNTSNFSDRCPFTCASEVDRVAHRQRCGYVPVECPDGCRARPSSIMLAEHASVCSEVQVSCPPCGAVMARGQLAEHLCPEAEVQCALCQTVILRRALPDHMEEAVKVHLDRLVGTVTQQDVQLRELRAMVEEQKTRIDDLMHWGAPPAPARETRWAPPPHNPSTAGKGAKGARWSYPFEGTQEPDNFYLCPVHAAAKGKGKGKGTKGFGSVQHPPDAQETEGSNPWATYPPMARSAAGKGKGKGKGKGAKGSWPPQHVVQPTPDDLFGWAHSGGGWPDIELWIVDSDGDVWAPNPVFEGNDSD